MHDAMAKRKKQRGRYANGRLGRMGRMVDGLRDYQWTRIRRPMLGAAWSLAAVGVAAAWIVGVPKLEARAAEAAWVEDVTIEFANLPVWVNGDLLAMLDLTTRHQIGGDPFRRGDLTAARTALLNTGWFDAVHQVRRRRADEVVVEATFVTPAAVVRDDEGDHLVDPSGRLLPRTFPHGGAERQLVITNAHFPRPERPGLPWNGADVTAALRLLRVLDGKPWRGQVAAIDASRYLAEEVLVIRTEIGARIVWGSAPGEESGLEVPANGKLAYLDKAFEEFNRIDTGYDGELRFYEQGYFAE